MLEINYANLTKEEIQSEITVLQRQIDILRALPQMQTEPVRQTEEQREISLQDITDSVLYARFYSMQQGVITGKKLSDKFTSAEEYRGKLTKEKVPAFRQDTKTDENLVRTFPVINTSNADQGALYMVSYTGQNESYVITGTGKVSGDFVGRPNFDMFELRFPLERGSEAHALIVQLTQNPRILQTLLNSLFENVIYPNSSPVKTSIDREERSTICSNPMYKNIRLEYKDLH
jgi:hypothetical protein